MEREQALNILSALANGVHPATGERFGADSPYQHPDTVRALYASINALQALHTAAPVREHKSGAAPSNRGTPWTREEEERLASAFDAGKSVEEIVRSHNRSRAAIEARLVKLGRLDPSAVTVPLRYPPKPAGAPTRQGA
ncbi:MAG: hypothetical protein ACWGMT_06150 [Burkholderiales bacterium]